MTVPSQIGALGQPCPISCLHRLSQVFRLLAKVRGLLELGGVQLPENLSPALGRWWFCLLGIFGLALESVLFEESHSQSPCQEPPSYSFIHSTNKAPSPTCIRD